MALRITLYFKWFDLWVGVFVDAPTKTAYIQFMPMFGLKVTVM